MTKKYEALALALIMTALNLALPSQATAQSNTDIDKVRTRVMALSASPDSKVEVKFVDKTKIKGSITSVGPASFNLKEAKTGTSQSIAYSEVESVSKASSGVSTKTWLIIGGIAAGAVTTWLVVKPAVCDGGAQSRGIC